MQSFHVGKGLSSGFFPKVDLKSHSVLLPALISHLYHARRKISLCCTPYIGWNHIKHSLCFGFCLQRGINVLAQLMLLSMLVLWRKGVTYPLGLLSAPVLIVFYYSLSNALLTGMGRGRVQSFLLSPLLTWSMPYSQAQASLMLSLSSV